MNEDDIEKLMAGLHEVDPARFYRVERYLDPEVQAFEVHHPVDLTGEPDHSRKPKFFSSVMVTYQGQHHSQQFEIPAGDLTDALAKFRRVAAEIGGKILENLANQDAAHKLLISNSGSQPS